MQLEQDGIGLARLYEVKVLEFQDRNEIVDRNREAMSV